MFSLNAFVPALEKDFATAALFGEGAYMLAEDVC